MKPSVGRIVHYVSYGTPGGEFTSECRAAIITEVGTGRFVLKNLAGEVIVDEPEENPWTVSLCVLNPTGQFFNVGVPHNEDSHKGGTWHWPERVD